MGRISRAIQKIHTSLYRARELSKRAVYLTAAAVLFGTTASAAFPGVADAALTDGLQGYWQLNDGSGTTAADASGNGNDGTLQNSPPWTSPGYDGAGSALQFTNEASQSVSTAVGLTTTGSISLWANPDSTRNYLGAAGWVGAGANYVMIDTGGDVGHWRATFKPGATTEAVVTDPDPIAVHTWSHLVMTWELSDSTYTIQLYVNGNFIGDAAWNGAAASMGGFYIGRTNYFTGLVDEVRLYDRVLDGAEATQLYGDGPITPVAPGQVSGLDATAVSNTQIDLSWTAPDNGGAAIQGYKIERKQGSGSWATAVANTGSPATTYQNTGLTKNTQYTYRVSAINAAGTGTASSEATATTLNVPPKTLTVNVLSDDGDGTCTVAKCTFRDALANAVDTDIIDFSVTGTIVLTKHEQIIVTKNITIDGPGSDNLTIDFDDDSNSYFDFQNEGVVNISGLTFTNANDTVLYDGLSTATYNISDCVFTGNTEYEAVYANYGTWNLDNLTFSNNTADNYAGAVYASGDDTLNMTIANSTFSNNFSAEGLAGAVYFYGNELTITGSTFSGNDTNGGDGAVKNYGNTLTLTNTTFVGNEGSGTAGVSTWDGGTTHIVNSTFYGNDDGAGATIANDESTVDAVNTVVYDDTCSGVTSLGHNLATDSSCPFTQHAASGIFDPAGLQDNGGQVHTVALLADSPAVDAGDDDAAPAADARGISRPQGAHADIGAYELAAASDVDEDDDGIDNSVENAAPNGGDANDDGTPDAEQANVVSFVDDQTGQYVALALPSSCTISSASTAPENANAKKDADYAYPAGMLNYAADCGAPGFTVTAQVYFYGQSAEDVILRKYDPATQKYTTVTGANLSEQTIGGKQVALAVYDVTDGGELDTDHAVNGAIVDPVGLAVSTTADSAVDAPDTGYGRPQPNGDNPLASVLAAGAFMSVIAGLTMLYRQRKVGSR